MSQSGYTPILIYSSATTTNVPLAANLSQGELAINTADGKLFYKDSGGTVQVIATKNTASGVFTSITDSGLTSGRVTFASTGGLLADSANLTFDGNNLGVGTSTATGFTNTIRLNTASGTAGLLLCDSNTDRAGFYIDSGATTPAYIFTNNTKPLVFSPAGAERMRLDSSGRLLVGTTSGSGTTMFSVNQPAASDCKSIVSVSTGTNSSYTAYVNNVVTSVGTENSAGGNLVAGSSAYASIISNNGAYPLQLGTNNTVRATIDSSGNLGLGVTPSAWGGSYKAFQIGSLTALWNGGTSSIFSNNQYADGTNDRYLTTATSSRYYQNAGAHIWDNAPSGTAGNIISYTQRMTLDASGNLGIGTTSPAYPLDIGASTSANAIAFTGSAANGTAIRGTNTNSSSYYTLTAMGGSGYGVSGWANSLVLEAVPASTGNLVLGSYSNSIVFQTGGRAERMRIDASGNLLVGCTTDPTGSISGVKLVKPDTAPSRWTCTTTSSKDFIIWQNPNGTVGAIGTSGTTTYYNTSSDYRLKENIAPMVGCLDKVAVLKPVTYKWKADGSNGQGFIAHELAEVVPDCVTGEKDATREEEYEINPAIPAVLDEEGNEVTPAVEAVMGTRTVPVYQGIDTSFLVATLTAAIQELNAKFEEYKASHP